MTACKVLVVEDELSIRKFIVSIYIEMALKF